MFNKIKKKIKNLINEDYWAVGIILSSINSIKEDKIDKKEVIWVDLTDKNEFAADPFIVVAKYTPNLIHIFYEIFSFQDLKGRIGHVLYDLDNLSVIKKQTIIEESFHLSFPNVFEIGGKYYMIPESSESGNIWLYEAVIFPTKWKKEKLISGFSGIDNTVIKIEDKWWLFSTDKKSGQHSHLYIFYSYDIKGPWAPHKKNPVKIDISSSRSAGKIFISENKILRPTMDNTEGYGHRIKLNLITELSDKEFQEETIYDINPIVGSEYPEKIHTINEAGGVTVIDGAKLISAFKSWIVFKCKLKRLKNKLM